MKQALLQELSEGRMNDGRVADVRINSVPGHGDQGDVGKGAGGPGDASQTGDARGSDGKSNRLSKVIGPDGKAISLNDLPPPDTKRWVIRRKAEVVAAVRGGLISLEEACQRYTLSVEEFLSWQRAIESFGLSGLRTTRLQRYRTGGKGEET